MKGESYEQFVGKFVPKKTTDDCYTPPEVYQAVCDWFESHVSSLDGRVVERPFYPGGDYQKADYPAGCVVIDNPPFSCLSSIVDWYLSKDIPFFLFCPTLQCGGLLSRPSVALVLAGAAVRYTNGAVVATAFVSNLLPPGVHIDGLLGRNLKRAQQQARPTALRPPKLYPLGITTVPKLDGFAKRGGKKFIPASSYALKRKLDCGIVCYPMGMLLSSQAAAEQAAAEQAAAEQAAAEQAAAERPTLSRAELELVSSLG